MVPKLWIWWKPASQAIPKTSHLNIKLTVVKHFNCMQQNQWKPHICSVLLANKVLIKTFRCHGRYLAHLFNSCLVNYVSGFTMGTSRKAYWSIVPALIEMLFILLALPCSLHLSVWTWICSGALLHLLSAFFVWPVLPVTLPGHRFESLCYNFVCQVAVWTVAPHNLQSVNVVINFIIVVCISQSS